MINLEPCRLFVIGLAPKHEIFVKDLEIKEVNFVIDDMDLTKNTVRGTKKKVWN